MKKPPSQWSELVEIFGQKIEKMTEKEKAAMRQKFYDGLKIPPSQRWIN